MGKIELKLDNKFLDTHTAAELEQVFWDWLNRYNINQGDVENNGLKVKVVVEGRFKLGYI